MLGNSGGPELGTLRGPWGRADCPVSRRGGCGLSNVPIRSLEELADASPRRISYQVRWELHRVVARDDVKTQEALSIQHLNRPDSTIVSKWINGKAPLPRAVAAQLDDKFGKTELGISWVELVDVLQRSEAEHGKDRPGRGDIFDVFLASPMAAATGDGTFEEERRRALDMQRSLAAFAGMHVYYAGERISAEDDFDVPDIASEMNFDALRESRYFVLMHVSEASSGSGATDNPDRPVPPKAPSSVWVEAGYALATRKPSLYFVRDSRALPYCLRGPGLAAGGHLLPPVLTYPVNSPDQPERIIRNQGSEIFARLDRLSVR